MKLARAPGSLTDSNLSCLPQFSQLVGIFMTPALPYMLYSENNADLGRAMHRAGYILLV